MPTAGSGHRAIAQEMRDRPQYLPDLRRTRWIIFVPGRGQARRRGAKDAHGYRRQGHLHHEPSELADQPSPTPARAIWLCRHDAGDPGFPGGPGDRLLPRPGQVNGTAAEPRRPGWRASRAPLRRPSPSPRAGVREGGGTPGPRVGSSCSGVRGRPRDSKTARHAKLGQRVRLPRRRTHIPARLCVPGGPALPQETGSLRLRPPLRDESRQEAWHGRA